MKKVLIPAFICLSFLSLSQPVIDYPNNILPVGSSFMAVYAPVPNIGLAGANQTWDFSQISFSNLATFEVVEPESSVFAAEFPMANWVFEVGPWTSYFEFSETEMNNLGLNLSSLNGTNDYSENPRKILEFPFTFEQSFTDVYFEASNGKNLTVTYDAYGTLIMPENYTYTNVIRVKEEEEFGEIVTRFYITEPFMNIALHYENQGLLTWIKVTLPNSINDNSLADFKLYPNPAENVLSIESPLSGQTEFLLTTMEGKFITSFSIENGTRSIDISNLENGIYFISNGSVTKPFNKL